MTVNDPVAVPDLVDLEAFQRGFGSLEIGKEEVLHELFERRAAQFPESIALECGSSRLTYGELDRRANQLSQFLRANGVLPRDCAGLLLPRSLNVCITVLAILKSGAAYVPLDPEYPAERVGFILSDCRARALITTTALASKAPDFSGYIIDLERDSSQILACSPQKLAWTEKSVNPGDLCYIIYTSGTTGQPKGVQIEHRSVCHLVRAEAQVFRILPSDRIFQGFSIAFDASVEETWLAFFAGATLVIGTHDMVHAGAGLSRILADGGITVLSCVPTLLLMMEQEIPSLRLLILGGETCPPDLVRRWWRPNRRVVNTYGPTEATVVATFTDCQPGKPI